MNKQDFDKDSWNDFVERLKNDFSQENKNYKTNPMFFVEFATAKPFQKNFLSSLDEKVLLIYYGDTVERVNDFYDKSSKSMQDDLDRFSNGSFKEANFIVMTKALYYVFPDVKLKESIVVWQKLGCFFTNDGAEDFKRKIEFSYPFGIRVSCENMPKADEFNRLRNAILSGKLTFKE